MKRIFRIVFTVCIMAQVLGLYHLVSGSQEMFPTPEQNGAVRIVGLMLISTALIVQIIVWQIRKKVSETKARIAEEKNTIIR